MYGWMSTRSFPTAKVGELLALMRKFATKSPLWKEILDHTFPQVKDWDITLSAKMDIELPEPVWNTVDALVRKEE